MVLKRFVVGDSDLLVKLYGYPGITNLYVKDGALPSNEYIGVFEPFNVLTLVYKQTGQVIVPMDVMNVIRLSYYATQYERYEWMCQIGSFILKFIRYFDENLFNLVVQYLKVKPTDLKAFHIRFYCHALFTLGIYREDIFTHKEKSIIKAIMNANTKSLNRLKLSFRDYLSIKEKIEAHMAQAI